MKRPLSAQDPHDVGKRGTPHLAQGLLRKGGRVRRDDHVRMSEQLISSFGWLALEHIKPCPGDGPGLKRGHEGGLVHDAASAGIDEIRL